MRRESIGICYCLRMPEMQFFPKLFFDVSKCLGLGDDVFGVFFCIFVGFFSP